jgi:stringent starvation protein B
LTVISRRPYFLRAMHEWMLDSGFTPHLVIDANAPGVVAPEGYATDGKLILNISPAATQALSLGNDEIAFSARFGGVPREVSVPIAAVMAIYARETGQGVVFSPEDEAEAPVAPDAGNPEPERPQDGRPHLKVIK